jgi:hypothetical protein
MQILLSLDGNYNRHNTVVIAEEPSYKAMKSAVNTRSLPETKRTVRRDVRNAFSTQRGLTWNC